MKKKPITARTLTNLRNIMLGERNQIKESVCYMAIYMACCKRQNYRDRKHIVVQELRVEEGGMRKGT